MAQIPDAVLYAYGVIASLSVEFVAATKAITEHGGKCPVIYKSPVYFLARAGVAFIAAGFLPVAFHAANEGAAIYLGASAPVIFDRLQRGLKPTADDMRATGQPHTTPLGVASSPSAAATRER